MGMLRIENVLWKEGFKIIAGIDEAGRGPLAGPVVASAVVLTETAFPLIIRDSKKLSPPARKLAFNEILKRAYVGVGIVPPQDIDTFNIYQASLMAMRDAVGSLKIKPDCLLIDGPYRIDGQIKNVSVIEGDSQSLSIACASIVAKVVRDGIMEALDKIYPMYNFKRNKGYGTEEHFKAIEKFGASLVHRLSFFPFSSLCFQKPSGW